MTTHKTGTREEWLRERVALLRAEKQLTQQNDALAKRRQELPWVPVTKEYAFDTPSGRKTLPELFEGRSQLMIYHFMFGPDYEAGCVSCSSIADSFDRTCVHLINHDVMFVAVSRAPLAMLESYKARMGWTFPWASSAPSDFNRDFNVWFTPEEQLSGGVEYNYTREPAMQPESSSNAEEWKSSLAEHPTVTMARMSGTDVPTYARDRPGLSAFVRDGEQVFHSYSSYARGLDAIWGMYQWLDRAPLGRNETGAWVRRRDEYGAR